MIHWICLSAWAAVMMAASLANATEEDAPAAKEQAREIPQVLIYSGTSGYRHASIEPGVAAIETIGERDGFDTVHTEKTDIFTDEGLSQFAAIVFLSSTTKHEQDNLDDAQKAALQHFVHDGGGILGIHAAADSNYNWPWYGKMIGGWFMSHPNFPNVREGTMAVQVTDHAATKDLPRTWVKQDEWYDFKDFNPDVTVLITVDEASYGGAKMGAGATHPISWYHDFEGGRVFYTAMGHTSESFSDELYLKHLSGAFKYVLDRDGE